MAAMAQPTTAVRLAELVAALSLGIDLGFGQPMEHVLRQCLIAMRLAGRMGLDDDARSAVYYTSLLVNVGCHSDAHEQAKWFGGGIISAPRPGSSADAQVPDRAGVRAVRLPRSRRDDRAARGHGLLARS